LEEHVVSIFRVKESEMTTDFQQAIQYRLPEVSFATFDDEQLYFKIFVCTYVSQTVLSQITKFVSQTEV
jgi:hypothetical protein